MIHPSTTEQRNVTSAHSKNRTVFNTKKQDRTLRFKGLRKHKMYINFSQIFGLIINHFKFYSYVNKTTIHLKNVQTYQHYYAI